MVLDKHTIRQVMKEKRLSLDTKTFFLYSYNICQKVKQHPQYHLAKMIGCYVSLPGEVDTLHLIEETLKTHELCVPKVVGETMSFYKISSLDDLQEGAFHVLEPTTTQLVQPQDIDLMIVPMLAYDNHLYRVGYGKGFYDKYFALGFDGYKLGLAFSFQKVPEIEINLYDLPLDEIICE